MMVLRLSFEPMYFILHPKDATPHQLTHKPLPHHAYSQKTMIWAHESVSRPKERHPSASTRPWCWPHMVWKLERSRRSSPSILSDMRRVT
jgi:hypothetical protein